MSTITKQNYLKTIFNSTVKSRSYAATNSIATELEVSNAAISDMAKKLAKEGLIKYEKYKGMELTKRGEKIALEVVRRHRLWELFLSEVLKLDLSEVHKEAEILEHHTSAFLIDKIDSFLNYPKFDPHGHPIPQKDGHIPKTPEVCPLSICEIDSNYQFVRVEDRESNLIKYLQSIGLELYAKIKIVDKLSYDSSITIEFNNRTLQISKKISDNIFVAPI
jgi:DtxR family Mn-dependent transcriptional regulator